MRIVNGLLAALLVVPAVASADTITYDYVGPDFTEVLGSEWFNIPPTNISGYFTVDLDPNTDTLAGSDPNSPRDVLLDFLLTDGTIGIPPITPNLYQAQGRFITDASGLITDFGLIFTLSGAGALQPFSVSILSTDFGGGGPLNEVLYCDPFIGTGGTNFCNVAAMATVEGRGTLTARIDPNVVSEPGTLALLGLGLVGMAARRRRTV